MPSPRAEPNVIELRQYRLHPGRRDELIELFDRELVETQEEAGLVLLGQFRDLDDPDRFVWLRGFADMDARQQSLIAFYGGPVWAAHRGQANATMVDSDDVLLLRPVAGGVPFAVRPAARPPVGAAAPDRLVVATIWFFPPPKETDTAQHEGIGLVRDELVPVLGETGPSPLAVLVTETAENTFPRLPVRIGENVVVVLTSYVDDAAYRQHLAELQAHRTVREKVLPALARIQSRATQVLRLAPTGRSLLR